ncbi:hypothetical protein [Streptomyces sp. NPDC054901]
MTEIGESAPAAEPCTSVVLPVTAQASCPIVVVGDVEHGGRKPPFLVVGVDGSESSKMAMAMAFQEAGLRGCELPDVSVWQPPVYSFQNETAAVRAQHRMLTDTARGLAEEFQDVKLTCEVPTGTRWSAWPRRRSTPWP